MVEVPEVSPKFHCQLTIFANDKSVKLKFSPIFAEGGALLNSAVGGPCIGIVLLIVS